MCTHACTHTHKEISEKKKKRRNLWDASHYQTEIKIPEAWKVNVLPPENLSKSRAQAQDDILSPALCKDDHPNRRWLIVIIFLLLIKYLSVGDNLHIKILWH